MEIVTQGASSFPPVELMELRINTQTEMEIVTQGASSFPPVELMELRINTHKQKWK